MTNTNLIKVQTIEDKLYAILTINGVEKDIELKDVVNYEQDYLLEKIVFPIYKAILASINFNEIYKGIQSLMNLYWTWQTCAFKNEDLSDLNKYRYRYEININDRVYKLFFDWDELCLDVTKFRWKFDSKVRDLVRETIALEIKDVIKERHYTKLQNVIQCDCSAPMQDIWDNI